MTYTPGPWAAIPDDIGGAGPDFYTPIWAGEPGTGGASVVARVMTSDRIWGAPIDLPFKENARLIAAAPEMLEALQSANEWMACVNPALMDGRPFKLDRARIRAAIAKATGAP